MDNLDPKSLAEKTIEDNKLFSELIKGLLSKKEPIRYKNFKLYYH